MDIFEAIRSGMPEDLERVLSEGADIDERDKEGNTPLHYCVEHGMSETAKALVAAGADVNALTEDGMTPLHLAMEKQDPDKSLVRFLVEEGKADITIEYTGNSPFHCSLDEELTEIFLNAGGDPDSTGRLGNTVLHMAKDEGAVWKMMNWGCDIEARNNMGETPLISTATSIYPEAVKALIERGADKEAKNMKGRTALMQSVIHGRAGCVEELVKGGADLETTTQEGLSLLHACVSNNVSDDEEKLDCARILIDAGLDPRKRDAENDSALDYAIVNGDQKIIDLLETKCHELDAKDHAAAMMERARSRSGQGSRGREATL